MSPLTRLRDIPTFVSPYQSFIGRINFGHSYEFRLCPQICAISSCFPHCCFQQRSWSKICGVRFTESGIKPHSTMCLLKLHSESRIVTDLADFADFKDFCRGCCRVSCGRYLHRSTFRGRMKSENLSWVVLGVNCLNQDLQD